MDAMDATPVSLAAKRAKTIDGNGGASDGRSSDTDSNVGPTQMLTCDIGGTNSRFQV